MKTSKNFFILILCVFTFQINAQFSLGVRGGYIKAWEEYGDVNLPDNAKIHVNGFQVSALAYFEVLKHISIGLEPGYAQRGAACVPGFVVFNEEAKLFFNYIELPLMIKVRFPFSNGKLEIFGKTGYGKSRIMKAFQEIKDLGSDEPPVRSEIDLNPRFGININRWDKGIYGGLGIACNIRNTQLCLESNYYLGLKDVETSTTSKNRSIHVGLGYLIKL